MIFLVGLSVSSTTHAQSVEGLTLSAPTACPVGGCAAGQRLNLAVNFNLAPSFFLVPNVQVCIFAPSNAWADTASFTINLTGVKSNLPYTNGQTQSICSNNQPAQSTFLGGAFATVPAGITSDGLNFGLRIKRTTTSNGGITVQIYDPSQPATNNLLKTFNLPLTVAVPANPAYVATDAADCGANNPCYINSSEDLSGGIGTGLKDAVDAVPSPAAINILGGYQVKLNTILIDQPDTILGMANASLTGPSGACPNPMLSITSKVTLQNLSIDGSGCAAPGRDLVSINSAQDVSLISNNLVNGNSAVTVADNTGNISLEFNQIQGNHGYGILRQAGGSAGSIQADANNIYNNQVGFQVECQNHGSVEHNFWGAVSTTTAVSRCSITDGKRLGAPIALNPSGPGLDAARIAVTNVKKGYFNQALSLQRSGVGGPFDLYVVNHSNGSFENVPFLGQGTSYVSPCSNYWDMFLPDSAGTNTPDSLEAFFRYDLNPSCTAQVQTICSQGNPAAIPLVWYDPLTSPGQDWTTTGSALTTACQTGISEIQLSIPSGYANLHNLAFVVGFPFSYGINLKSFTAAGSPGQVLIQWQTNSENNLSGFYISRASQPGGPFARVSGLIPARGGVSAGGLYSTTDQNIPDGSTFYYRLEVVGSNNQVVQSFGPVSASTPGATPTITLTPQPTFTTTITYTPTITLTPTRTPTPTKTNTPTITRTPTSTSTDTPTITSTSTTYLSSTPTATSYYYYYYFTPTRTRTPTFLFTSSRTNTPTLPGSAGGTTPTVTGTIGTSTPSSTSDASGAYPVDITDNGSQSKYPSAGRGYPAQTGTVKPQVATSKAAAVKTPHPGSSTIKAAQTSATPVPTSTPKPASQSARIISLASGTFFGFLFLSIAGFFLFQKRSFR